MSRTEPYKYYYEQTGNIVAVDLEQAEVDLARTGSYEAWVAVFNGPNSPVTYGGASPQYLDENCVEVSEEDARLIHPRLFETLDENYDE